MKAVLAGVCLLVVAGLANITYWVPDADAEVLEFAPDGEFGYSEYLGVRCSDHEEEEGRSFIHFDLSDISPGTYVEYGILYLHLWWTPFNGGILTVCNVEDDWEEYTITWNNQPEYDPNKVLFQDWIQWYQYMELQLDGSIIQEWIDNPLDNNGMVFLADSLYFYGELKIMSRETDDEPLLELVPDPFPVESLSWGMIKATEW